MVENQKQFVFFFKQQNMDIYFIISYSRTSFKVTIVNKTYAILLIEVYLDKITSLNLKRHSLFLKFIQTTGLIVFMKTTYQDIKKKGSKNY